MGLIDPETSDGRVIFLLPWMNHTIAGTTGWRIVHIHIRGVRAGGREWANAYT